jgi:hypothetical protein
MTPSQISRLVMSLGLVAGVCALLVQACSSTKQTKMGYSGKDAPFSWCQPAGKPVPILPNVGDDEQRNTKFRNIMQGVKDPNYETAFYYRKAYNKPCEKINADTVNDGYGTDCGVPAGSMHVTQAVYFATEPELKAFLSNLALSDSPCP